MNYKHLFLSILLLLLATSCGKKRSIHIVAKNPVTGEAYGGLEYIILSSRTTMNGEKFRTEASGTLNENGEVVEDIKVKNGRTYKVRVTEPSNTCYNKEIEQYFESKYDVNGTFIFEFAPCAKLQQIVKNVSCIDASDKIEIYMDNTVHSLLTTPWILNGCANYTTVVSNVPTGTYNLHWIVTKNSVSTDYYDSFTLQVNELKVHEINY